MLWRHGKELFQVQCYLGFPGELQLGPGFRVSGGPSAAASLLKYAHRWNPFVDDDEGGGESYGVSRAKSA